MDILIDLLLLVIAGACAWFIGPQVVLSLLYALPRAVYLALRGTAPWSLALEYVLNPAIWIGVLGAAAFVFPTFSLTVALMGLVFGIWALIGLRDAARADFETI